jgi:hypothetical protein
MLPLAQDLVQSNVHECPNTTRDLKKMICGDCPNWLMDAASRSRRPIVRPESYRPSHFMASM